MENTELFPGKHYPENIFPTYPWQTIKEMVIDKFVWFGRICSIVIGIYSIFSILKSLLTTMINCMLLRKVGGGILDIIKFTISPSAFLLRNLLPPYEDARKEIFPPNCVDPIYSNSRIDKQFHNKNNILKNFGSH